MNRRRERRENKYTNTTTIEKTSQSKHCGRQHDVIWLDERKGVVEGRKAESGRSIAKRRVKLLTIDPRILDKGYLTVKGIVRLVTARKSFELDSG